MPTLDDLAAEANRLVVIAQAARARGLEVGELLGRGGYASAFAVELPSGPAVLKIPAVPLGSGVDAPYRVAQGSITGPMLMHPPSFSDAEDLLCAACDRQLESGNQPPLARLLDRPSLAGVTCAIYEDVGRSTLDAWSRVDATATLPRIAEAIRALHGSFGPHGDLKPSHVFLQGGAIRFIDPLIGGSRLWIGTPGYSLPMHFGQRADIEILYDIAGLAAMTVRLWNMDLGWDAGVAYNIANQLNGRFAGDLRREVLERQADAAVAPLPAELAEWVRAVVAAVLDAAIFDEDRVPARVDPRELLARFPGLGRGKGSASGSRTISRDRLAAAIGPGIELRDSLEENDGTLTFDALDRALLRRVLVRVLRPELAKEELASRFAEESRILASCSHPNLLRVHRFASCDGVPARVEDFVDGCGLLERTTPPWDVPRVVTFADQVAGALAALYAAGVQCADLGPLGIMLHGKGSAMLRSLGSRAVTPGSLPPPKNDLYDENWVIGNPLHYSPEKVRSANLDARSDQYVLALLMYELLAGELPGNASTSSELMIGRLLNAAPPLASRTAGVPAAVSLAIDRALAIDAKERFDSIAAFLDALRTEPPARKPWWKLGG